MFRVPQLCVDCESTEQSSNDKQKSYSILLIEFETIGFSALFRSACINLAFHV